jgi:dephospho-CoA kinase
MKVLGLTGGIGSGKSTVAQFFKELGVPVYIADDEAKKLMHHDEQVKKQIIAVFGDAAYRDEKPDREFLASQVFHDEAKLEQLNSIIHPAVAAHFDQWKILQRSPYVVYEAAILFEKGGFKKNDYNLLITAPYDLKVQRLLERDGSTLKKIHARMNHQWSDEKKAALADFVLENIDLSATRRAVEKLHENLLESA